MNKKLLKIFSLREITRRVTKLLLIFLLIISWIFSGYSPIWQNPRIPPEIEEAQAAEIFL